MATATFTMGSNIENLTMSGTANINATGNSSANVITGNSGDNMLLGMTGNDTIVGGGGADTIDGGTGTDSMTGGGGADTYYIDVLTDVIVEGAGGGTDTVSTMLAYTLGTNIENLTLTGTTAVAATGNDVNNVINGNSGNNTILGLAGNDKLNGGAGSDTMNGGDGADHFIFSAITTGTDTIVDFNDVASGGDEGDKLVFQGLLLGNFAYMGSGAFSGGKDNTEARMISGAIQMDINGDGKVDFTIKIDGLTSAAEISASDFLFT